MSTGPTASVDNFFDLAKSLQARIPQEGRVLKYSRGLLGLFDPAAVAEANTKNYAGLRLPPRLWDRLRGRKTAPPLWEEVRSAFLQQMRAACSPSSLAALHGRMRDKLAAAAQQDEVDLTELCAATIAPPLIPSVVGGLTDREFRWVERSLVLRQRHLLSPLTRDVKTSDKIATAWAGIRAGFAVRRVLAARARGRRPPQDDLAQALVPMLDRLPLSYATYSVTTLLTAMSGAPGSVAACALLELSRHPEWRDKIRAEWMEIADTETFDSVVRRAAVTHRFAREVLRLWTFPMFTERTVRTPLTVAGQALMPGDPYAMSSYIQHRDPTAWTNPDAFDPDRWLRGEPSEANIYAPFGWAPRGCVGANLGLAQLILFCRLVTMEFDIAETGHAEMLFDGFMVPGNFKGTVRARAA